MNTIESNPRRFAARIAAAACCLVFGGCAYDVPITPEPTGKIEARLLGDWEGEGVKMKVRKFDDFNYVVDYWAKDEDHDDRVLLRASHSDVAKTSFLSVQNIESNDRVYFYIAWKLSDDGKRLGLRAIDLVPRETKDSASVQRLLKKELNNPELAVTEMPFTLKRSMDSITADSDAGR